MAEPAKHGTSGYPIQLAIVVGLVAAFLLIIGALAVAGSYALTIHTIDAQQATATRLAAQQHTALCRQLVGLDDVKNGIHFSPPTSTGTAELYVLRLSSAIHSLVEDQGCH